MGNAINILYVIHSFNNGGAETLAIRLADKIDSNRFHVSVCALCDEGPLRAVAKEKNIHFFSLGKKEGKDFRLIWRLRRLLKEQKIDVVHTHNQGPLLYTFLATRFFHKIALIHTEHINVNREISYTWKSRLYCRIMYRSLDGFVSIAQHLTSAITATYNLEKVRVTTILNCVEVLPPAKITTSLKREIDLDEGIKIIGNISALRKQKNHVTLIKAMTYVTAEHPNVALVIAGEGEEGQQLKELADQLLLSRYIYFLGYRSDVSNLLQQFDLFVLPSLYEGLPLCMLEAMSVGLPIVATDVEGSNELVKNGENGILVQAQSPEELAGAIITLLSDKQKAQRIGGAAKMHVQTRYSMQRMIDQYETFYNGFGK